MKENGQTKYLIISNNYLSLSLGSIYLCILMAAVYAFHINISLFIVLGLLFLTLAVLLKLGTYIAIAGDMIIVRGWFRTQRIDVKDIDSFKEGNLDFIIGNPKVLILVLKDQKEIFIQKNLYNSNDINNFINKIKTMNSSISDSYRQPSTESTEGRSSNP
jgi:hypothetical protein